MQIHEVILVVTVLVGLVLHLRWLLPTHAAGRRLEAAVRQRGFDPFVDGIGWQLQMFGNSKAIFCDSDTPEIRALKQDYYDKCHYSLKKHSLTAWVIFSGFALSILVCWIEMFFKR